MSFLVGEFFCLDCVFVDCWNFVYCMYLVVFHWWIWDHVMYWYTIKHPGCKHILDLLKPFFQHVSSSSPSPFGGIYQPLNMMGFFMWWILEKRHRSHWDGWCSCCLILHITIPDPCLCCHFRSQATSSVKMTGRVKQRLLNGQILCFHVWNVYPTVCKRYLCRQLSLCFPIKQNSTCKSFNGSRCPRIFPKNLLDTRYPHGLSTTKLWTPGHNHIFFSKVRTRSPFCQPNVFRIRINFWLIIWYCKCLIPNFPHSRQSQQRSISSESIWPEKKNNKLNTSTPETFDCFFWLHFLIEDRS